MHAAHVHLSKPSELGQHLGNIWATQGRETVPNVTNGYEVRTAVQSTLRSGFRELGRRSGQLREVRDKVFKTVEGVLSPLAGSIPVRLR